MNLMPAMIEELVPFEEEIQYRQDPPRGRPSFAFEEGAGSVIISAPHGAGHWRSGK